LNVSLQADDLIKMQNPDTLLPTDFGGLTKKKRVGRIIDDDEVRMTQPADCLHVASAI
jgi:hypothetical protein